MSDLAAIVQTLAAAAPAAETAADAVKVAAANSAGIGKGLAYGIAAGGAGIGIGLVVAATLSGIARQPEQANTLRGLMFIGVGFIEALALIGLGVVFLI